MKSIFYAFEKKSPFSTIINKVQYNVYVHEEHMQTLELKWNVMDDVASSKP